MLDTKIVDDLLGRFKRYRLHMMPRSACFVLFLHAREERRVVQRHSCRTYTSTVSSSLLLTFLYNLHFITIIEIRYIYPCAFTSMYTHIHS